MFKLDDMVYSKVALVASRGKVPAGTAGMVIDVVRGQPIVYKVFFGKVGYATVEYGQLELYRK